MMQVIIQTETGVMMLVWKPPNDGELRLYDVTNKYTLVLYIII